MMKNEMMMMMMMIMIKRCTFFEGGSLSFGWVDTAGAEEEEEREAVDPFRLLLLVDIFFSWPCLSLFVSWMSSPLLVAGARADHNITIIMMIVIVWCQSLNKI